jgi:hypothetical protein
MVLRARHLFLQQRGEEAVERVLSRVQPEVRALLEEGVLETRWYPGEYFYDLIETADEVLGEGDLALVEEMGAFSAQINLTGPLRTTLFKFGNPKWGLKFAPRGWSAMFDQGEMVTVDATSSSAELCLRGVPGGLRPSIVAGSKGWLLKAVELFGAEVQTWELKMDHPNPGEVTFTCEWF